MPGQGMRVSAYTVAFNATHGERLCEGEAFVPCHSAAVRRARQRGHGQVVPRSGQCRRCVRARAGRKSKSDGRRPGSWAVRRPLPGHVAGEAGRRRLSLVVLATSGPAQQLELEPRWVGAERRRARWELYKPRTRRRRAALAGRSSNQAGLYSGGGGWSCSCAASTGVGAAAASGTAGVSTEGAGKGALAAEKKTRLLRRWHYAYAWRGGCAPGKGFVRENGVPLAAASSGLSSSPET
eukprot:6214211-Pleurochrysis_carterae.AAC.1